MLPPAGKCRIWMDGVPAAQQPAPTDCTTALRKKPANGILIFGPAKRDLLPFDVRNGAGAERLDASRRAAARTDSSSRASTQSGRERSPAGREADTRQLPPARTAPASREPPPTGPRQPPPPPPKKPEKP
jgi:hypothetical protein